jgi:hypothetical protein
MTGQCIESLETISGRLLEKARSFRGKPLAVETGVAQKCNHQE